MLLHTAYECEKKKMFVIITFMEYSDFSFEVSATYAATCERFCNGADRTFSFISQGTSK